jgi:hypothetical protein
MTAIACETSILLAYGAMKTRQLLAMMLVVALLVLALRPAPAEAIDPFVVGAIAGAAVAVLVIVVYLVVANVEGDKRTEAVPVEADAPMLVYVTPATASSAP